MMTCATPTGPRCRSANLAPTANEGCRYQTDYPPDCAGAAAVATWGGWGTSGTIAGRRLQRQPGPRRTGPRTGAAAPARRHHKVLYHREIDRAARPVLGPGPPRARPGPGPRRARSPGPVQLPCGLPGRAGRGGEHRVAGAVLDRGG